MSKNESFDHNSIPSLPIVTRTTDWSFSGNIGLLGGTGAEGKGIAARFASVGFPVLIGSREKHKAKGVAARISTIMPLAAVSGTDNENMIQQCDVIFLTVPFAVQHRVLIKFAQLLTGKIVVCTSVPVQFSSSGEVGLLPVVEGGASLQAKVDLPTATVVGAFQNIAAADLWNVAEPLNADAVVASDNETAKQMIMDLCSVLPGLGVLDGGGLDSTPYLEALTVLLLRINQNYPGKRATVKFSGLFS